MYLLFRESEVGGPTAKLVRQKKKKEKKRNKKVTDHPL